MTYHQIEFSPTITFTDSAKGWQAHDHTTGERTRGYDTLIELNAAVCDGTAGWAQHG